MSTTVDDAAIKKLGADPEGPIGQLILRKAIQVETIAKTLVKLPGSGRIYEPGEYFLRRGGKILHWTRTTSHQASAPGEPPAGDTGLLGAGIHHTIIVRGTVVGQVQAQAKYGIWLELGTRFMRPRPFLRPALSAAMKQA